MANLTREQLEKLTTKRLLAYKNSLLKVVETADWDSIPLVKGEKVLGGKESPHWQEHYNLVKEILAAREHVERKPKRNKK